MKQPVKWRDPASKLRSMGALRQRVVEDKRHKAKHSRKAKHKGKIDVR